MSHTSESPGVVILGSDFKALGVARSLGRRGVRSVVVDNTPRSAWLSRYVMERRRWDGGMDSERFVEYLLALGADERYTGWLLIPAQDDVVELVARNHDALATRFRLVTQGWDVLKLACDKGLMNQMANAVGVAIPTTWYPLDEQHLASMDITFPAILKPAISIRLQDALRLKALPASDMNELRAQYRLARQIMPPEEVMVQEVILGGGAQQVSVAAYAHEGDVVAAMTARRTRQYPIDYGLGSSFVEAKIIPGLVDEARKLIAYMGLTGMVEVEFKRDPRTRLYKLLDINVRPWGWHTLAIACGFDFPYMQYCDTLGFPLPPVKPRYDYRWRRMVTDIPAGIQELSAGLTTPMAYMRSLIGKTTYSVFDWRDPVPAATDLASVISRFIRLRRKRAVAPRAVSAAESVQL